MSWIQGCFGRGRGKGRDSNENPDNSRGQLFPMTTTPTRAPTRPRVPTPPTQSPVDRTAWLRSCFGNLRRKRHPRQNPRLLGRGRSIDYTFPVMDMNHPEPHDSLEGRGREAIAIPTTRPPKPLKLQPKYGKETADPYERELGPLTVPPQPDWRRLKNRSAEFTRPTVHREGSPVGSRMYTVGTNPGQLMESETPIRNVFYDPRKKRPARYPKDKNDDHGSLNALKNTIVKYTRVETCETDWRGEAVGKLERDTFGIEMLWIIGGGAFGEVQAAKRIKDNELLAVKVYFAQHERLTELKDDAHARNSLVLLLHEIIVMKILRGKAYFVQILDHFIINERIYLVMEMEDDTLSHQLGFYPNGMPEAKARKWFFQMTDGIAYMHKIGITHGDIHAGNIMIRKLYDGTTLCKYTDFGVSRFLPHAHENIKGWMSAERDRFKAATRHYVPNQSPETRRLTRLLESGCQFCPIRKSRTSCYCQRYYAIGSHSPQDANFLRTE